MVKLRSPLALLMGWWFFCALASTPTWAASSEALSDQFSHKLFRAHVVERVGEVVTERDVNLPYHWDVEHPGVQGEAEFTLNFEMESLPHDMLGVLIPKVGNAYTVRLNGLILQSEGDLLQYNGADFSQIPRYLLIAPSVMQKSNRLQMRIRADAGRRGGLAPLVIGPADAIYESYLHSYHLRSTASLAVAVFSAFISFIAFSLWATQVDPTASAGPRRDPLYLYAALAEFFWSFGSGYILLEKPPVDWPAWGVMSVGATIFWSVCMALFGMQVAGWLNSPWSRGFKRWLQFVGVLSVSLAWWGLTHQQPRVLTVGYSVLALTYVGFCVTFILKSLRGGNVDQRLVAVVVLINVIVGARDLYVFRIQPTYGEVTWLRYSSVLFGMALMYILIARFRAATTQSHELLATLSARVAAREQELGESFQRLEQLARQQERTNERTRILRDMHDGVGSHISSAMRQLQSGQASPDLVMQTLRDSLDHLKLSIDAMNLAPGDITALLANVRYRLGPRFEAMNLELEWAVEALPLLTQLDSGAMRQLQFIVFEAFSNVLQHSHATRLRIEGERLPAVTLMGKSRVRIKISDNGVGFDTSLAGRRGLTSMAARAQGIGAQLHLRSQPGATEIELLFTCNAE